MYRIKDWALHFENAESRKIKGARWLPLPNKHDGKGFRRLTKHARKVEIMCAWTLILQFASKCPVRGEIADENGPLTAQDIADVTDFPVEIFELAFEVLQEPRFGWIEDVPWPGQPTQEIPSNPPDVPAEYPGPSGDAGMSSGRRGNELKGTEGKGTEIITTPLSPPLTVTPFDLIVTDFLDAYPKEREREGGRIEKVHVGKGDRPLVASAMNADPSYPWVAAAKWYAKSTRRPKNLREWLSNPTAPEIVLKALQGAQARDAPLSDATPSEPLGTNEDAKRAAAKAFEILHGRKHGT